MGRRPKYSKSALSGFLVVDKPLGWSSMDVVRHVRRAAGNVKTGHAGTLDPLATGVVVCCLGQGTKHVERIMGQPKIYETDIDLSAFTLTDDREGERTEVEVDTPPTEADVLGVLEAFKGEIQQVPPAYSAVHVNGKRAYKLAREGKTVELEPRTVRIDELEVLDYAWPTLRLRVVTGKGFYVRSMARDIGKALGTGGHLSRLVRTAVGDYRIEDAHSVTDLAERFDPLDVLPLPN